MLLLIILAIALRNCDLTIYLANSFADPEAYIRMASAAVLVATEKSVASDNHDGDNTNSMTESRNGSSTLSDENTYMQMS